MELLPHITREALALPLHFLLVFSQYAYSTEPHTEMRTTRGSHLEFVRQSPCKNIGHASLHCLLVPPLSRQSTNIMKGKTFWCRRRPIRQGARRLSIPRRPKGNSAVAVVRSIVVVITLTHCHGIIQSVFTDRTGSVHSEKGTVPHKKEKQTQSDQNQHCGKNILPWGGRRLPKLPQRVC